MKKSTQVFNHPNGSATTYTTIQFDENFYNKKQIYFMFLKYKEKPCRDLFRIIRHELRILKNLCQYCDLRIDYMGSKDYGCQLPLFSKLKEDYTQRTSIALDWLKKNSSEEELFDQIL